MNQKEMIIDFYKNGLDHEQISELLQIKFGESAYKSSTIYKWMKEAKLNLPLAKQTLSEKKEKISYDEQLLKRIQEILKEEPFSSIRSIASKINAPKSTVYRYMKDHLHYVYRHTRWLPHFLTNQQKLKRVKDCEILLGIINSSKHNSYRNIITGDQSWFLYKYQYSGKWILETNENPKGDGSKISISKIMFTIIWGVYGFYVIDMLPNDCKYNSQYFIDNILQKLIEKDQEIWPRKSNHKIWIHIDNCSVHNSMATENFINKSHFKRAPHPPYSPDIAPSDFFLFGFIKDKLKGNSFNKPDEVFEAVNEILAKISHETLIKVFKEWESRCKWVVQHNGEYYDG